jgi:hypothetical protein
VVKTIKGQDKDVIKFVKLDPATKSAAVSGTTLDWEKDGTVYYNIVLRKGQRLLITADSTDINIETYNGFEPYDGAPGKYELEALLNTGYQIVARSRVPGKKYTLTLKLR